MPAGRTVKIYYLLGLCTFLFQNSQALRNSRICSQMFLFGFCFPVGAWTKVLLSGVHDTSGFYRIVFMASG